jgi:flagellar biosynthesis protein
VSKDEKKEITEVAALQYSPDENQSPKVIALGKGVIGEKILEAAKENNIPVFQDANLAHTLNKLHIGEEIPAELYAIVAEILVFVSNLDKGYGEKNASKK